MMCKNFHSVVIFTLAKESYTANTWVCTTIHTLTFFVSKPIISKKAHKVKHFHQDVWDHTSIEDDNNLKWFHYLVTVKVASGHSSHQDCQNWKQWQKNLNSSIHIPTADVCVPLPIYLYQLIILTFNSFYSDCLFSTIRS